MDWDKLRIFHTVAEAGSFTHAGERLNLTQSSVSRQVGSLEDTLGVPLFHRHARGLQLTEQGETLYKTAQEMAGKLALAERLVTESLERPRGPLRITTTVAFGSMWLTERLKEFVEMYPEIEVSLIVREDALNLSMRQADIAIRLAPPQQPDLIQRLLFTLKHAAYASMDYLERFGMPHSLADLVNHRLIAYDETYHPPFTDINWLVNKIKGGKSGQPVLRVNNIYAMYVATANGMGIASLPDYMVRLTSGLVPVLPELEGPIHNAYFVYPEELRHSRRVAVFRDFLLRRISQDKR
ncbi:LysR family transcriptional regulator [Alphaproteobacteria bacterium]|nr:LysR family transcriptional regulator [Alphaproteobacteria bacterium]